MLPLTILIVDLVCCVGINYYAYQLNRPDKQRTVHEITYYNKCYWLSVSLFAALTMLLFYLLKG